MGTWQSVLKQIEKKRARISKQKGGFDFSYMDVVKKNFPTNPETGRPFYCKWCVTPMYISGIDRRKGDIILSCEKDECIGNVDTPEHIVKKKLEKLGLDTKLNFNGKKSILNRMTNQNWMDKFNPL